MEIVEQLTDVSTHVFELAQKDGFLATNSLLLNAVLLARAYGELDQSQDHLPNELSELRICRQPLETWLEQAQAFVTQAVSRGAITVIYSPLLRPIAADLESKLSEAALLHIQLADLRSYAHGRHTWLADRPQDCAVLAVTEPSLGGLWDGMQALFPADVPTLTMHLDGAAPSHLIAGLIAQMHLISAIARNLGKDAGRPTVPPFGRDLYYLDLPSVIPVPAESTNGAEQEKYNVLGARWPSARKHGSMRRARDAFRDAVEKRRFRAIVFDYDGTLCASQRADSPPPLGILKQLERLIRSEIIVGIASGRGGSIQECLRDSLCEDLLSKIQLGLSVRHFDYGRSRRLARQ